MLREGATDMDEKTYGHFIIKYTIYIYKFSQIQINK